MKEVAFIDGKTTIKIEDDQLAAYLERLEAAGYIVKANKCKTKEGFRDILMVGKARDFEVFFSGKASINETFKQSPGIYRLLFNSSEIILYFLGQNY